ncbi:MAG TPA: methyltransferase domain-containing protein [Dehalococcoidia bacterium]|nr:methyltransferase domain-containing protein [Dehalococcoidia bacterium]
MPQLPDGLSAAEVEAAVRDRYSQVGVDPSQPAGFPVGRAFAEAVGYPAALLDALPAEAAEAFAGVACPVPHAALRPGETVVDLGCGAGLDSLYAGRSVGPTGCVVGIDFAPAMIARAERSFAAAGMAWVEARLGDGRRLPLANDTADVVLVNGIFNLNPDKAALLREAWRVLRPGGRLVAAEITLTAPLPPAEGHSLDDWFR